MANPLMGMMDGGAPAANQTVGAMQGNNALMQAAQSAKRMMGMLNAAKNPQQAFMQVAQQNPQLNAVMQLVGGRNPQEVFYEQCQKKGVNPEDILRQLR